MSSVPDFSTGEWLIISIVWLVASFGSAAALATLYKRLHPELSLHRLWAFWVIVLSVAAAAVLAVGVL